MTIKLDSTIGEIVKKNFKTAPLFHANKIDYCCGGHQTISEACEKANVEPINLINQLEDIIKSIDSDTEYINSMELDSLCDYIVGRHHSYVEKNIPFLKESLDKICFAHGANHPELFEIRDLFFASADELTKHMQKEEIILFPYIKKMIQVKSKGEVLQSPNFGNVSNPIETMMQEHENEGERFEKISAISNNYTIPPDACTTYQAAFIQLKEFENDLHKHIFLENSILFPKAINLEKDLSKQK